MLRFNYKGRTVAYMDLKGVSMDDIRAARSIAADLAHTDVTNIHVRTDANGCSLRG